MDLIPSHMPMPAAPIVQQNPRPDDALRTVAQDLEASFLAEMLKSAGLGQNTSIASGGVGEEHFNTFLIRAQAEQMAQAGGMGLADALYRALKQNG